MLQPRGRKMVQPLRRRSMSPVAKAWGLLPSEGWVMRQGWLAEGPEH